MGRPAREWFTLAILALIYWSAVRGDLAWVMANGFALLYVQSEDPRD